MRFPRSNNRRATFRLHRHHARSLRADPAHLLHFVESFTHADQPDAPSGGIKNHLRQFSSELLPQFISHRFLASTRYGSFRVETSYHPSRSLRSATYLPQSEINPFSLTTFAPNAWHSITLASGVSAGITITAGSPAAAA